MLRARISLRPRDDGAPAIVTRSPTTTALGSAPRLRMTAIDAVSASHYGAAAVGIRHIEQDLAVRIAPRDRLDDAA